MRVIFTHKIEVTLRVRKITLKYRTRKEKGEI